MCGLSYNFYSELETDSGPQSHRLDAIGQCEAMQNRIYQTQEIELDASHGNAL